MYNPYGFVVQGHMLLFNKTIFIEIIFNKKAFVSLQSSPLISVPMCVLLSC